MRDVVVKKQTGRTWAEWVGVLDRARAVEMPHREIAQFVSSLGTPGWWTQMVPNTSAADAIKKTWTQHLDRLAVRLA